MSDETLKNCPFCGSEKVGIPLQTWAGVPIVRCEVCHAEVPGIAAWNRRHPDPQRITAAMIERIGQAKRDLELDLYSHVLTALNEAVAIGKGEISP